MHLKFEFGEAIEVDPVREKRTPSDPLMDRLRDSLTTRLGVPPDQWQP